MITLICQLSTPMNQFIRIAFTALFFTGLFSCKKSFAPPVTSADYAYLVVEGVINSGSDSTTIKLSRTVPLGATSSLRPETGARVLVESDQNAQYLLAEAVPGSYVTGNLNLPLNQKYRLHIYTSSNNEYVSDFVENKVTPAVDSISYQILSAGVQFYVSTHDPNNSTRYYRWEYGEAWTYYSVYPTVLMYQDGAVIGRPLDSNVNYCYKFSHPYENNIYAASSDKLAKDEIYEYPLGYVPGKSWKFQSQYCFTVMQYALTADAYKFWQLLKNNTENLGSIFDAQPTGAPSNFHCVSNPAEPVIGYASVSTMTLKRIFFNNREFPFPVVPPPGVITSTNVDCSVDTVLFQPNATYNTRIFQIFNSGAYVPVGISRDDLHIPNGYKYALTPCVDCRVDGGTTIKPSYWPF